MRTGRPTRRRLRRLASALAVLAIAGLPGPLVTPAAAAPGGTTSGTAESVRVQVLNVSPSTPAPSDTPEPLTVELELTNTTDKKLDELQVRGARGNPIVTQQALDAAIADPQPPAESLAGRFQPSQPVLTSLDPGQTRRVVYASTSDRTQAAGLCICQNRIYPLYFTVLHADDSGSMVTVGSAQTFIPSFGDYVPEPVSVSWVWPLLERPHRLDDERVFLDDDLATSVASGGRLDHMLEVLETTAARVPMTVLTDPDLIDELAVMAAGDYRVRSGDGTRPGKGTAAARAWLQRLRAVLDKAPAVELAFTAFADPDVDSLSQHGLDWTVSPDRKARERVSEALGGRIVPADIAWPADGTLHAGALDGLARKGTHTVILDQSMLPGAADVGSTPDALAPVQTGAGPMLAAVTSPRIQPYVGQVMDRDGPGLSALPLLVSEVALRAVEDGSVPHYVVLTAPRDLDPDPGIAARAILDTTSTIWSTPLPLRQATRTITPVDHGQLTGASSRQLPAETIAAISYVTDLVPSLNTLFPDATDSRDLLGALPAAAQRIASISWLSDPVGSRTVAQRLREQVAGIASGVHLLTPTTGTYTLGSDNSPLPISIENTLSVPVQVRIRLSTVGGLPGFSADDIGVQRIAAGAKLGLHIPVQVERAGRIKVRVELTTPDDTALGQSIVLSVRSTALGTIGKIITIVAGVTLALALAVRVGRRWRARRAAAGAAG